MRLSSEIDSLRMRALKSFQSVPAVDLLALPAKSPPFSRVRPVVQRAYRADGQRVRDGGGLSSPLLVDPATVRADGWPDVLEKVRTVLHWAAFQKAAPECMRSCSVVCSKLMRGIESQVDVSGLERQYADM